MELSWNDLTEDEQEAYVNQDYVGKDREISYVGGDRELDYLRMNKSALKNHKCIVNDTELGELEIEIINKLDLTDRQRECVIMHYVDRMKEWEIADELGISQRAVSYRLEYAKKKIWRQLKQYAGEYYINHNKNEEK